MTNKTDNAVQNAITAVTAKLQIKAEAKQQRLAFIRSFIQRIR